MRLHHHQLHQPALNLHHRVRDAVQAILRQGVHGLLHGAELVGGVFVEDGEPRVQVLGAGDERFHFAGLDPRVQVGALRRLEHQLFEGVVRGGGLRRGAADADDADSSGHMEFRESARRAGWAWQARPLSGEAAA